MRGGLIVAGTSGVAGRLSPPLRLWASFVGQFLVPIFGGRGTRPGVLLDAAISRWVYRGAIPERESVRECDRDGFVLTSPAPESGSGAAVTDESHGVDKE